MLTNRLIETAQSLASYYAQRADLVARLRHQREDLDAAETAAKPNAETYATLGSNKEARELAVEKMLASNPAITAIKKAISDLADSVAALEATINGEEKLFQALAISVNNESNTIYGRRDILGGGGMIVDNPHDLAQANADEVQAIAGDPGIATDPDAYRETPDLPAEVRQTSVEEFLEEIGAEDELTVTDPAQPAPEDDIPF